MSPMHPIYESSPQPEPDSDFLAGELSHLVAGNCGRMLDARRTPIQIVSVRPETGCFELAIRAFEDVGARWELSLESVYRFQFLHAAARATVSAVAELKRAQEHFAQILEIPVDPDERERTLRRVASAQARLGGLEAPSGDSLTKHIRDREGSAQLAAHLRDFLKGRNLLEIDRVFTRTFVSNPASGGVVKGHEIVLAELGLCPFKGQIVRDAAIFDGPGSKEIRAEHLIARLAFTRALWHGVGRDSVVLYRGAASDGPLGAPRPSCLLSATFSEEVARAHFQGAASTRSALLQRRRASVKRLLMTFLETEAMNERFREAEAVLLAGPTGAAF